MRRLPGSRILGVAAFVLGLMPGLSAVVRAQSAPGERLAAAVEMLNQKKLVEARDAFTAILTEYDTPDNRANIEFDSLLAGSHYYLSETYFQEDRFEEAAAQYMAVIGAFRTYQPESLYHLGLSKHYRQDYAGAIEALGDLATQYPSSPLAPRSLYYQGVCYELLKNKLAARAAFQTMIERYPDHAWTTKAREKAHE